MRVKELIKALKQCDKEAEVVYDECAVDNADICSYTEIINNVVYIHEVSGGLRHYVKVMP